MEQFLILVYTGLTGSVTMITCTVLALTRLVFEYKGASAEYQLFPLVCSRLTFVDWIQLGALVFRLHRGDHHGAAAAQHLSSAIVSYQRDSESRFRLHQGHPLHHGAQDTGLTCNCDGMRCTLWMLTA